MLYVYINRKDRINQIRVVGNRKSVCPFLLRDKRDVKFCV